MRLHALSGLPRSGTTLIANVLAQHPDIHVSGTSALPLCVEAITDKLSEAPEVMSDLANVPRAYQHYVSAIRGFIDGWYYDQSEEHVIDKGRGWIMHRALLHQVAPGSALLVSVRDPRDVIASIERKHRKTAVFNSPVARTIYETAEILMQPDGMVGGPMRFCEDLIRRNLPGVVWVRYESFTANPEPVIERIHEAMGCEPFKHDYANVQNTASDLDALYRGKFPHIGSGEIKPTGATWQDTIDPELSDKIANRYPLFMQTFAYAS
jgi:sulfotransferase